MTTGAARVSPLALAIGAAVVAGLVAGLAPRPAGLPAGDGPTTSIFAAIASAAIVALAILPFIVRRRGNSRKTWIAVAAAGLSLGLVSYTIGNYAQRACMAQYGGRLVVVGTEMTPLGAAYARANPDLSRDELLFDSAGVADRIWTRHSIDRCRVSIASTYFLWVPFLVASIMAAANAVPASPLPAASRAGPLAPTAPAGDLLYDVFISYRHGGHDSEFATYLLASLEAAGYTAAIDERDFPANASFLQEMERCIRASRFTVAVISLRYLGSGNCEEEAIICKVLDMGDRRRRLIPLIIEPVALPAWLYGIVGIDYTRTDALVDPFDKLIATLGPPLARVPPLLPQT